MGIRHGRTVRVTISIGGAFPSPYQYAEFLEREGYLERIISFMPRWRLKSKFHITLPDKRLITLPWIGALYYGLSRFPMTRSQADVWVSALFEYSVQKCLGPCNVFNGWNGMALLSMRRAKAHGAVTVLCTGSAHIAYQKKLLQAEYAKFGLKRMVTHPHIVEKGVQEYVEADHIIVPSTFVRRTLLAKGIEAAKISVVPHSLTRQFVTSPKADSVFRIIAVGGLGFRKGIQYLLEAVSQLRLPNSELILVGGSQNEFSPILKKYVEYYKLAGYVSNEKLGQLYSQSSVFVLPSVEDGWGHVTLEAMSCGLPAIVSANAGSADAVQDGVTGFLVPACNVQAIIEKLEFLYKHSELRDEMGRQAQLSVQTRTAEVYGRQIKNVFEALLQCKA